MRPYLNLFGLQPDAGLPAVRELDAGGFEGRLSVADRHGSAGDRLARLAIAYRAAPGSDHAPAPFVFSRTAEPAAGSLAPGPSGESGCRRRDRRARGSAPLPHSDLLPAA